MNKKLIALAVAGAIAAPLAAQADVTVYGRASVSLDKYDVKAGPADPITGVAVSPKDTSWNVTSNASRVGIKAAEDLGGGLKGIAQIEWGVDMADNSGVKDSAGSSNMTARNQVVGLAGGFGTFVMGRHDTPYKMSTGKLDFFADTAGDYNNPGVALGLNGGVKVQTTGFDDQRANNAVAYISPDFSGLTIAAAIVPGEQAGTSTANGLNNGTSIAAMYSNGPLYVSLAYENFDKDFVTVLTNGVTSPAPVNKAYTKTRLGLGYSVAGIDLAFVAEQKNLDNSAANGGGKILDGNKTYMLGAKYTMGDNAFKADFISAEETVKDAKNGFSAYNLGFDHNFSKATTAYVVYSNIDEDKGAEADGVTDTSVFSLGLVHSF